MKVRGFGQVLRDDELEKLDFDVESDLQLAQERLIDAVGWTAWEMIWQWHQAIRRAIERRQDPNRVARALIQKSGYAVTRVTPHFVDPAETTFAEHLVKDEMARLRRRLEHKFKRKLTDPVDEEERRRAPWRYTRGCVLTPQHVDRVLREAALDTLRRKAEALWHETARREWLCISDQGGIRQLNAERRAAVRLGLARRLRPSERPDMTYLNAVRTVDCEEALVERCLDGGYVGDDAGYVDADGECHGVPYLWTLEEQESFKRSNRRRKKRERDRAARPPRVRLPISLRERIQFALRDDPKLGKKALARLLRVRPETVAKELEAMRAEGVIVVAKDGQKHQFVPVPDSVPPYRVESGDRVRIAGDVVDSMSRIDRTLDREDEADEAVARPARRAVSTPTPMRP